MKEHELRPPKGANRPRKRVGRGTGSGHGKTSGRGTKGQNARTGGGVSPYFEGGQLPFVRRLPFKRGKGNAFALTRHPDFSEVNIERLAQFEANSQIDPAAMAAAGLIRRADERVKVLGMGELDRPLTVRAHKFSAGARQKIEAAGGTVEEIAAA